MWDAPPWESDKPAATWLVRSLDGTRLRGLLQALVINADGGHADDLVAHPTMAYAKSGIPAGLKHLAMRCRQAGHRPMWDFTHDTDTYSVPADVAAVFTQVLATEPA